MIIEVFEHALMISSFVMVMMLVIEYVNVLTRGRGEEILAANRASQPALGAVLGSVPGCLGAFAAGSLYTHNLVSFGALVATMIATSGDEAFIMLAMFPGRALLLFAILFVTGIVAGSAVDLILKRRSAEAAATSMDGEAALPLHPEQPQCGILPLRAVVDQWRHCSLQRGALAICLLVFVLGTATGEIGHGHGGGAHGKVEHAAAGHEGHAHDSTTHAACEHEEVGHAEPGWMRWTLFVTGLLGLFIVATVPEHFLEKHLWDHIVKTHIWRVFLWTLGALFLLHLLMAHLDVARLIEGHHLPFLLAACLVGLIPESGPHLLFVTLYAEGSIPFSILVAGSIVQDGHGMIPLLAHSRRTFAAVKGINLTIGLALGLLGYLTGW
jgi:hypothetical protein